MYHNRSLPQQLSHNLHYITLRICISPFTGPFQAVPDDKRLLLSASPGILLCITPIFCNNFNDVLKTNSVCMLVVLKILLHQINNNAAF